MRAKPALPHHFCAYVLLTCLWLPATAQSPNGATKASHLGAQHLILDPGPVPLNHLYWHLFSYQMHLDTAAAGHEKQGKDGRWLRDHLQTELHFDDADMQIFRSSALTVTQEVERINIAARAVIVKDQAFLKKVGLPPGTAPPGKPTLELLNHDREEMLNTQIGLLDRRLGPQKAEVLKTYIHTEFAKHVSNVKTDSSPTSSSVQPR